MCEYVKNQIRFRVKLLGNEWDERNMVSWKKEHENFVSKWSAICISGKWCDNWIFKFVCVVLIVEYKCAWE